MKRAAATHACDAPGCALQVPRAKLMCRGHWFALPRPLREAINASWREGRIRDWTANRQEAHRYLAGNPAAPAPPSPHVTPERAAELSARLIGERP